MASDEITISRRYGIRLDGSYVDAKRLSTHLPSSGSPLVFPAGFAAAIAFVAAAGFALASIGSSATGTLRRSRAFQAAVFALISRYAASTNMSVVHGPLVAPYTPS